MLEFNWGIFWAVLAALAVRGFLKLLALKFDIGTLAILHHMGSNLFDVKETLGKFAERQSRIE